LKSWGLGDCRRREKKMKKKKMNHGGTEARRQTKFWSDWKGWIEISGRTFDEVYARDLLD